MEVKSYRIIYRCMECDYKYQSIPETCSKCNKNKFKEMKVYCLDKILSFDTFMNIIIGARDTGKSYAIAEFLINEWKQYGRTFVWLKREKTEFMSGLSIFSVIFGYGIDRTGVYEEQEYTDKNGKIKKKKIYFGKNFSVTMASKQRGEQVPDANYIWWDEYVAESGFTKYNELNLVFSIMGTIYRGKNKTKFFVTSNKANRFLELLQYADIDWDKEWNYNPKKKIITHVADSIINVPIGAANEFLAQTPYYEYAYNNKPMDYDAQLVESVKLEFLKPEFCFKVGSIKQPLRIMEMNNNLWAIDYCKNCNHKIYIIDSIHSISDSEPISLNKQEFLMNKYVNKLLRYSNPRFKTVITDWVGSNLHLLQN